MIKSPSTPLLLLFSLTLAVACEGDDDDKLKFEGILLKDEANNSLGTKGTRDLDDWQNDWKLDKKIVNLLDFETQADMSNTDYALPEINAYPNPASDYATISFSLSWYSLVKIIIVNEELEVLYQRSHIGSMGNPDATFTFDLSDPEKFQDGKIVRAYYSISSKDDANYFVGHGDIWICREECN